MLVSMYSIRDVKTTFMPPATAQNEDDAKRSFAMMVNNPSGVIGFAPKDFDLYYVGDFDTEKGEMVPAVPVQFVISGTAVYDEK